MNITSAQYVIHFNIPEDKNIKAVIDGVEKWVPIDNDNSHYQAILEWAEEDGNEIQAAE